MVLDDSELLRINSSTDTAYLAAIPDKVSPLTTCTVRSMVASPEDDLAKIVPGGGFDLNQR